MASCRPSWRLRLLALTFVRTNELRGATWAEIDLDKAEWTIPAERMKTKIPHHVPLSGRQWRPSGSFRR